MLENKDYKYYGNYRGKVLDNNDPDKKGRIKVQVHPCFDGVDAVYLPWAIPATPLFVGAGVGSGCFCLPDVNSWVWVFFENGDYNQPVFFAEATDNVHGIPTSAKTNYPTRRVIHFSSGTEIIIDETTGDITITGSNDVIIQGTNSVRINPL